MRTLSGISFFWLYHNIYKIDYKKIEIILLQIYIRKKVSSSKIGRNLRNKEVQLSLFRLSNFYHIVLNLLNKSKNKFHRLFSLKLFLFFFFSNFANLNFFPIFSKFTPWPKEINRHSSLKMVGQHILLKVSTGA